MKRYANSEVLDAIEQVERGVFTPHAQIVLAGEVCALRVVLANVNACVSDAEAEPVAWSFRDLVIALRAALQLGGGTL